jgi:hypothetical protein
MKLQLNILPALALFGCQDQVTNTRTETDIRALRVEVESLRTELERTHVIVQRNKAVTAEWEDDVAALWTMVGESQDRLDELESAGLVTEDWVDQSIGAESGALGELAARVNGLESSLSVSSASLTAMAALSEKVIVNSMGDVIFHDTNVFIQNGTATSDEVNGKGNLVLGYNASTGSEDRAGSHNLIVGDLHGYAGHSSIVAGQAHQLSANYSAIIGGIGNRVTNDYGAAIGGQYNVVDGMYASAVGGGFHLASGANSAILGGYSNTTSGMFSNATGGRANTVGGAYSTATGGSLNTVDGASSTVSGGHSLEVTEAFSIAMLDELDTLVTEVSTSITELEASVAEADAEQDAVLDELADADRSLEADQDAADASLASTMTDIAVIESVLGDASTGLAAISANVEGHATHIDDLEERVSQADELMAFVDIDSRGDVVFQGTNVLLKNGGGTTSSANGKGNLILGYNAYDGEDRSGSHNLIIGDHNSFWGTSGLVVGELHELGGHGSAILSGTQGLMRADASVIVGGHTSDVTADFAAAIGGAHNTITGAFGTTIGGYNNTAAGDYAAAGPGRENSATGPYATAMGGALNLAEGDSSAVFGGYAVEASATFSTGEVTDLIDLVESEQSRLDGALESLGSVSGQTDNLLIRMTSGEDHNESQDTIISALDTTTGYNAILIAGAAESRGNIETDLAEARSDFETADSAFTASILSLQTVDEGLTSDIVASNEAIASLDTQATDNQATQSASIEELSDELDTVADAVSLYTGELDSVGGRIDSIEENVSVLETHKVQSDAFFAVVDLDGDGNVLFSNTNLLIQNGMGDTSLANGTGNLVLGYNSTAAFTEDRTGSHNLVIGDQHHYSSTGGIVTGVDNQITGAGAVVLGGTGHLASGNGAAIMGGANNDATQAGSALVGGQFNTASGGWSVISGGEYNTTSALYAAIVGGHTNSVTAELGVVVGGHSNEATAVHSTALGGQDTVADTAFEIAPIDDLDTAIADLEVLTDSFGTDVVAELAANTGRIDDLESDVISVQSTANTNTTSIDANTTDIASNTVSVSAATSDVSALETADDDIWLSIDDLDTSRETADNFLNFVTVSSTGNIIFEDTNLIVRNSSGSTDGETDGKGNIVIGYNEIDDDSARSGSHNLVLGVANSYASHSGIIAGYDNVQLAEYSSILGGTQNTTTSERSVIVAGQSNVAAGPGSVVIAGHSNHAEGQAAVVIAGLSNFSSGLFSAIVAGTANDTTAPYAVVVSGNGNEATGQASAVVGGQLNEAAGASSVVLGGKSNVTSGSTSAIVAGWLNRTGAQHAAVLGGYDNDSAGDYSSIGGGFKNDATHSGSWVAGEYAASTGLYAVDY